MGPQFGIDGPVMTGTWVNPKTGHKFTVQDCFFEDSQFKVQTTTGQILDFNTIQDYVQATSTNAPQPQTQIATEQIPAEIAEMLDDDMMLPEDKSLGNLNDPKRRSIQSVQQPVEDTDMAMIKRVLKKFPLPELDARIKWPEIPIKQMDTLVNVLGIEPESIAAYHINQLDRSAIFEYFVQALGAHINKVISTQPQTIDADQAPKQTPKKTTKKTTKK